MKNLISVIFLQLFRDDSLILVKNKKQEKKQTGQYCDIIKEKPSLMVGWSKNYLYFYIQFSSLKMLNNK